MVSVVVLGRNIPQRLFKGLSHQSYWDFEIILASEDGIVSALNKALFKARGDIFVRIDTDVELPYEWLEELIKPFKDPTIAGVTGPTYVPHYLRNNRDSIKYVRRPNFFLWWLYDNDPYAPAKIYKCGCPSYGSNFYERIRDKEYRIDHLEGTNWAMRTHLIKAVGGFDPKFDGVAEWFDTDVEFKIKKLGYTLHYNTKAYLYHMLEKGEHYNQRFDGWGRIKNYLRFHFRHSKFHPKMIVYLLVWGGYFLWKWFQSLYRH